MDGFVKAFLKASLVWLVLGTTGGIAMALYPAWTVYRPAHAHVVMLGFVAMMIFGVAYHVVPRFSGAPLPSRRTPAVHWAMSNAGLLLLALGFMARANGVSWASWLLSVGGALSALGAYLFSWTIWRTIDASPLGKTPPLTGPEPVVIGRSKGHAVT
jgi:cbb3-type cytochrome oxidase subunit 1